MTGADHLTHLNRFLETIQKSGLTLGLKKSTFVKANMVFVGHVIGLGQIKLNPHKLQGIEDLQPPKTKKEIRSVIGFFSYFRAFIPALAKTVLPLTKLTQKDLPTKVQWGIEQQTAFDNLKYKLMNAVTLT